MKTSTDFTPTAGLVMSAGMDLAVAQQVTGINQRNSR